MMAEGDGFLQGEIKRTKSALEDHVMGRVDEAKIWSPRQIRVVEYSPDGGR